MLTNLGRLKVLAVFKTGARDQIIGGKVLDGRAKNNVKAKIIRDKKIIGSGKIIKLQSGKQDVESVEENQECGLQYEGDPIIEKNDILEFIEEKEIINKL